MAARVAAALLLLLLLSPRPASAKLDLPRFEEWVRGVGGGTSVAAPGRDEPRNAFDAAQPHFAESLTTPLPGADGRWRRPPLLLVTKVRNEGPYVAEWIEYHRLLGVDAFLLYEDMSTDGTAAILREYQSRGIVHVINHFSPIRSKAYAAAVRAVAAPYDNQAWVAMIDGDEFMVPAAPCDSLGPRSPCLVDAFEHWRNTQNATTLVLERLAFGSGGQRSWSPEPVTRRFVRRIYSEDVDGPRSAADLRNATCVRRGCRHLETAAANCQMKWTGSLNPRRQAKRQNFLKNRGCNAGIKSVTWAAAANHSPAAVNTFGCHVTQVVRGRQMRVGSAVQHGARVHHYRKSFGEHTARIQTSRWVKYDGFKNEEGMQEWFDTYNNNEVLDRTLHRYQDRLAGALATAPQASSPQSTRGGDVAWCRTADGRALAEVVGEAAKGNFGMTLDGGERCAAPNTGVKCAAKRHQLAAASAQRSIVPSHHGLPHGRRQRSAAS
eukprot:TRINITY_DN14309_c0_g1_i2.p1 TRINITY_DN14309_c0_g1~~TRINITY_DN14309_c0_g1_i2.p1  ORF type:complete len:493 (+),score=77.19 TRINITY_DN14309_c0_g1_i2:47-1525(+)